MTYDGGKRTIPVTFKFTDVYGNKGLLNKIMFLSHIMASERTTTILRFVKLTEKAFSPKESSRAAGFDLKSAYDVVIPAGENALIQTDLAIQVPVGCYGRIAPRSGLAWHHKISVLGGVVHEDYRGAICVILFNHSKTSFYVNRGLRVAQLICEKIYPELN
jgi:dUTP pyrophosphatase